MKNYFKCLHLWENWINQDSIKLSNCCFPPLIVRFVPCRIKIIFIHEELNGAVLSYKPKLQTHLNLWRFPKDLLLTFFKLIIGPSRFRDHGLAVQIAPRSIGLLWSDIEGFCVIGQCQTSGSCMFMLLNHFHICSCLQRASLQVILNEAGFLWKTRWKQWQGPDRMREGILSYQAATTTIRSCLLFHEKVVYIFTALPIIQQAVL